MAVSTATLSPREQISLLINTQQPAMGFDQPITPAYLENLIGSDKIADVALRVQSGRQAREYVLAQDRRASSLSTFCEAVFYSYLPKGIKTETLGEIFHTRYHRLDPETRIAMYEKWLADLPYREFSHLTAMFVRTHNQHKGPVLPTEIERFSHLTELTFSPTFLSLPAEMTRLPNLTTLDLRCYNGNDLENLKDVFRALPRLVKIIFRDDFKRTEYAEVLQQEFSHIQVEFQEIPEAAWSPV
jgi:hypothetical protein